MYINTYINAYPPKGCDSAEDKLGSGGGDGGGGGGSGGGGDWGWLVCFINAVGRFKIIKERI